MSNIESLQKIAEEQDQLIVEIMNDVRIPSYIRDTYANKYNDFQFRIARERNDGDDSN